MSAKFRLAYLVSHPIQYQAPLLRAIAADPDIELKVFFCSDISVRPYLDAGFGSTIEWDVPLLDGYDHAFLPALDDTSKLSLVRPFNFGLAKELRNGGFDLLWVHGYMRSFHLISMGLATARGMKVLNRDEAWERSASRGPVKRFIKRRFYALLRRICDGWLVIGSANRDYYLANGMKQETVFSMPYAVDNVYFRTRAEAAAPRRAELRAELGLEAGRPVILFAAKFLMRKRPHDLLEAFARIAAKPEARRPYLVLVGDGEMRETLERRTRELGLDTVRFTGFRNQSELPRFYDLCDVFVLPSLLEPWGLVVNEVMNAGRAVIVSDQVGAAADLVRDGENGCVFAAGDVAALANALGRVLADPERSRQMGMRSLAIIEQWGFHEDLAGLKQALAQMVPG
jgi:glycosyltransferase involved in cell wall biosynthesis